ncbi:hypothetical protein SAMN05518801_11067 [Novosphingobium sp. CF614]|uniref:tetratricopeptide repeat protein n=1 Tax=Novosphingobium sp. CF614 TaxID=1884364 RepID=UPI0008EEA513|nr:hypothetical protein [Novosphingobium sp. CF614]SFG20653.1 hypothetical protein SAMN05518801_11067 [Novosphingobium sp. CF614]
MIEGGRYVPSNGARIALLSGALVFGWIAVRAAAQASFQNDAPQLAVQFWPANGQSLAVLASRRVASASGEIDDATRVLYRSALARAPMLSDPLALAGLDVAAAGDLDRAERLMIAARDRNPRSSLVRFWLFDHFVRSGQYTLALDEVGPAIRLEPEAITAVMTVLGAIANDADGQAALAKKLATGPFWSTAFFQTAVNNASPNTLLALLSVRPDNLDRTAAMDEQRAVFYALIKAGQGARAFQAWRQLLPESYRTRAQGVYDGNFGGWPGAQPFNWTLQQGNIGTARTVEASDLPQTTALDVRYFGSTGGVLAEQYVYASPGAYQFQLAARRRSQGATGGRLSMELRCVSGNVIATLPLDPLDTQLRRLSTPVQVTPGCEMLRVRLMATPGEMFSEIEAQITGVALVPGS